MTKPAIPAAGRKAVCPSIFEQTGWKRPYPQMICQDISVLARITRYDFNLSDSGFRAYAQRRGVLHVAGKIGSPRWRFIGDFSKGRADFMGDAYFNFAQEYPAGSGVRRKFTREEMAFRWKLICIARGKMQDAWELYRDGGHTV